MAPGEPIGERVARMEEKVQGMGNRVEAMEELLSETVGAIKEHFAVTMATEQIREKRGKMLERRAIVAGSIIGALHVLSVLRGIL